MLFLNTRLALFNSETHVFYFTHVNLTLETKLRNAWGQKNVFPHWGRYLSNVLNVMLSVCSRKECP